MLDSCKVKSVFYLILYYKSSQIVIDILIFILHLLDMRCSSNLTVNQKIRCLLD